ncbi:MAG: glycerophosphoryl diester phosphodiesterase membrane domain-containing protein [Actinobacteria bacterium]|nr:glycerophosphoryl diester phosphodiesterase membrane domain-containing protein [Actinomycetota bacterium]MBU4409967.1 glycerophosphoryl diester phosphodiesterase membrane domain-containing protein [Actinomycetota bacterium]MBU4417294.1 glycerophosphoryl diester phosphodiesterase membrane domain-containing protein [Actinomycetota bacterium]MBU4587524.1 glycerophosphoryl diester phosphodiesterase membrane domain-containing protein [Actinomycetota bacterium]
MTSPTGWDVTGYYAAQLLPEQAPPDATVRAVELGIITPRPLQLGDILSGAFRAVRYSPVTMFGVTLMGILIAQVLALGVGAILSREFDLAGFSDEFGGLGPMATWATFASYLSTALATLVLEIGLTYAVHEAVFARRATPADTLRRMGSRVGAMLGFSALVGVGIIVLALLIAFVANTASGTENAGLWLVLIPLVLATLVVVPWLSIRLLLVPPAIAIEKLGPLRAIRRSWELTRGQFWRLFGIYLLSSLLISMATNMVSTVFSFAALMVSVANQEVGLVAAMVASTVATVVLSLPLTTAVVTLLYVDTRIRHEGYDLTIAEALYG